MLQLRLLNDSTAGTETVARRFPFRIGRSEHSDLRIELPGVWDEHATISVRDRSLVVCRYGDAALRINGKTVDQEQTVRSGDLLELGSAKIRIALGGATQHGAARQRIALTGLILGITAVEAVLYFWLTGQ